MTNGIIQAWIPQLEQKGALAQAIVRCLEQDVHAGRLEAGAQLPTQRALADLLGVTVGTVTRAYNEARRRGLIHGRVGQGTFVSTAPRPTLAPAELPQGPCTAPVDLSVNLPLASPEPDLAAALRALADQPDLNSCLGYQSAAGSAEVRAAGAQYLTQIDCHVDPDQVLVCNGAQHALHVALSVMAGPGELVHCEQLTYPGFISLARRQGLRLRGITLDPQGLVPEDFATACHHERPRVLYCQPMLQNPTNAALPLARRLQIVELARRHDVLLLVDEVNVGLVRDSTPSFATLAPERTVTIAGVSKPLHPGLRTAFMAAPQGLCPALKEGIWTSTWMASTIGATIAARWISDGTAVRATRLRRKALAPLTRLAERTLAGLRARTLFGSYHVWLELPPGWDSSAFSAALQAQGVLVTPERSFLAPSKPTSPAVRISLSGASSPVELEIALCKIRDLALFVPSSK